MSGFADYDQYDGLGLAGLVRRREVTPRELVEAAIERIETLNPQLNAVVHKMYDQALAAAESDLPAGPWRGVPFLLKDLLAACAGAPLTGGSRFNRDYVPGYDSEVVRRFKAAGLIIIGKTNTPEYGLQPVTEPELFGPCRNPWDLSRTPGGSSGGSAAAVAARMVPAAHGNDGAGSIRIPSACCGVFGLKPSRGRTPVGPDFAEVWQGQSVEHVLTRSVRDSAALLDAIAGPEVGDPYTAPAPARPFLAEVGADPGRLRIAFTAQPLMSDFVHDDCRLALASAVDLCRELGHEPVEAAPPIDGPTFTWAFLTMLCAEVGALIDGVGAHLGRQATARDFEATTWALGLMGRQIPGAVVAQALHFLRATSRHMGRFMERYDLLLTPTLALPPVPTGSLRPEPWLELGMKLLCRLNAGGLLRASGRLEPTAAKIFRFMPYTALANATGQPAMSVPLYWNEAGLPIGLQFIGRYGDEASLLRLASQLEQARPWRDRVPPVSLVTGPLERQAQFQ